MTRFSELPCIKAPGDFFKLNFVENGVDFNPNPYLLGVISAQWPCVCVQTSELVNLSSDALTATWRRNGNVVLVD